MTWQIDHGRDCATLTREWHDGDIRGEDIVYVYPDGTVLGFSSLFQDCGGYTESVGSGCISMSEEQRERFRTLVKEVTP